MKVLIRTVAALGICTCAISARAAELLPLSLAEIDLVALEREAATVGETAEQRRLARIVVDEVLQTPDKVFTSQVLKDALSRYLLEPRLTSEQIAQLYTREMVLAAEAVRGRADEKRGALPAYLSFLLVPHLLADGLCAGNVWSSTGLVCGFAGQNANAASIGSVRDSNGTRTLGVPRADSNMGKILQLSMTTSATDVPADLNDLVTVLTLDSRVVVVRLGELEFDTYVTKLNAAIAEKLCCYDPEDIFLSVLYSLIADEFVDVEIYGEYYLSALMAYGSWERDSAFLVYPFGYSCSLGDCRSLDSCAARTNDLSECEVGSITRGFWDIRPSSYLKSSIAACYVEPIPYPSRPTYQAIQQDLYVLPGNVKFQTKHQQIPAVPVATDTHLGPSSSSYTGPLVPFPFSSLLGDRPTWQHSFSKVRTWDYDFVFSGLRWHNNLINSCSRDRVMDDGQPMPSGDIFWMWHGQGHDDARDCKNDWPFQTDLECPDWVARADGGFPMPATTWGVTWQIGYAPFVTPPATLGVAGTAAQEGQLVDFVVTRTGNLDISVSVQYATAPGTALSEVDFTAAQGTVTFAPGETTKTVRVSTLRDSIEDPAEQFTLRLSLPSSGAMIVTASAAGTILTTTETCPTAPIAFGSCTGQAPPTILGSRATIVVAKPPSYDGANKKLIFPRAGTASLVCEVSSSGANRFRVISGTCQPVPPEIVTYPCDPDCPIWE